MSKKLAGLLLFLLGFGIFMFTRRSEIFPTIQIAILIAPIFILRFIRTQPRTRGIFLTLLGFLLSMNIALWGLFDMDNGSVALAFNILRSSMLAILYFLPYMIDRLVYNAFKNKGVLSTLTFPVIMTAIFFLSSLEGPFDGDSAKTIFDYGPLMFKQLASLFGLWGFVFIFSWLAAIINHIWEKGFSWKTTRKMMFLYGSLLLIILSYGTIRLSSKDANPTVKIAAVVLVPEDGKAVSMEKIFEEKIISPYDETMTTIKKLTEKAATNQAKIVAFQEFAMTIREEDQEKLIKDYQQIAMENQVYLSITYAYFSEEEKGENKHLVMDNKGQVKIDYTKRYLLGFGEIGEAAVFKKGAESIQTVDTPYGRIGASICRDMSFSAYIRQAGRKNVDIMIAPSYDFPKSIGPSDSIRAVEYGLSFVRPTYNGITYAQDYHGRILAQMDSDQTKDGILYADVPIKGIKTLYTVTGDILGWACVLALLGLIIFAISRRKKH